MHGRIKFSQRAFWLLLFISWLLIPSFVFASAARQESGADSSGLSRPSSRSELWRRPRLEKESRLRPEETHAVERFLVWIEDKGVADGRLNIHYRRVYPGAGITRPLSGPSLGARYWHADIGDTLLDVAGSAAFSVRGYEQFRLQFGRVEDANLRFGLEPAPQGPIFLRGPRAARSTENFFLLADIGYARFARENFFGLGQDSSAAGRSDFRLNETSYDGTFGYQITPNLSAAIRGGLVRFDIGPGNDADLPDTAVAFTETQAPGLDRQPGFLRFSADLVWDRRDKPGNPHRGGVFGISFSRFDEIAGKDFQFNRFTADSRYYFPLGSDQQLLAVRFFTTIDGADSGGRVPFYLQQTLGGGNTLRGFREMRFRGENLIHFSAEYRWEAAVFLEAAIFYDAGKAVSERSDYNLRGLEKSPGFGIRLKTPFSTLLRLDAARGKEGIRLQVRFGPSF